MSKVSKAINSTRKFARNPINNSRKAMHNLGEKVWPMPTPVDRGRKELAGGRLWLQNRLPLIVGGALVYAALHPTPASPAMKMPEVGPAKPPTAEQLAEMKRWADAETLATPFGEDCGISEATDTHRNPHLRDGKPRTTVVVKVRAPLSDQAKALYPKYEDKKAVSWANPAGIGFILPPNHPEITHTEQRVADDNGKSTSDIKDGQGTIVLFPPTDVPDGTRVGVYARVDTHTEAMGEQWVIHGDTPCGELVMEGKADGNPTWQFQPGADMSPVITAAPVE
jgi:hypothetical protein